MVTDEEANQPNLRRYLPIETKSHMNPFRQIEANKRRNLSAKAGSAVVGDTLNRAQMTVQRAVDLINKSQRVASVEIVKSARLRAMQSRNDHRSHL